MVTSLVSLTEHRLTKPLGGCLTCLCMYVSEPECMGQSVPPWLYCDKAVLRLFDHFKT